MSFIYFIFTLGGVVKSNQPKKSPQELSAEEIKLLLNQVALNDHKAYVALYNYFMPQVARWVHKMVFYVDEYTRDGIVNAVLYAGLESAANYRGEGEFGAFLRGVARNLCNNHIRSHRNAPSPEDPHDDLINSIPDDAPGPEDLLIKAQDRDGLYICLQRLPAILRDSIVHTYLYDLSVKESSEELDIAEGTVKSRNERARRKLRECMENWRKGERK